MSMPHLLSLYQFPCSLISVPHHTYYSLLTIFPVTSRIFCHLSSLIITSALHLHVLSSCCRQEYSPCLSIPKYSTIVITGATLLSVSWLLYDAPSYPNTLTGILFSGTVWFSIPYNTILIPFSVQYFTTSRSCSRSLPLSFR